MDLVIAPANGGQPGQNQVQESAPNEVQEPASRKVVPVGSGNDPFKGEKGLADSGATHALREGIQEEMRAAKHVPVTLASDEKSTLCQSPLGTILMPHPTRPLVPMGALVESKTPHTYPKTMCRVSKALLDALPDLSSKTIKQSNCQSPINMQLS